MQLNKVKRLAAGVLKTGKNRIWLSPDEGDRIKEIMTKEDVRELISEGIIKKKKAKGLSRARARKLKEKKKKGRKKGPGKRKGSKKTREEGKKKWIKNVRAQRRTLKELKKKKEKAVKKIGYRKLYKMIKGNYFKGKKYLQAFVEKKGEK